MSVLWRKRERTHLELVSSDELFARRLPSSADTLPSVSTGRRSLLLPFLFFAMHLRTLLPLGGALPIFVSASTRGSLG